MTHLTEQIMAAAAAVRRHLPQGATPKVGLVLGSGLGAYADTLSERVVVPYGELPGFPVSRVVGHAGNLVYGRAGGLEVLAMQGRVHAYEGHSLQTVVYPVRALIACGCHSLIITNAAGGIAQGLGVGELVLLRDHINLMGGSSLLGDNDAGLGPRFPDMSVAYDPALRALAQEAARQTGMAALREGVYAGCLGPQYETPSEVRMLGILGADLVGMSTVPEVIAARHMGARVLGISCVTNLAAGISKEPLSHAEVTETTTRVRAQFMRLIDGILGQMGAGKGAAGR